ncbi:hypothetical protein vseg_006415 [Gypsophila vaccaria]
MKPSITSPNSPQNYTWWRKVSAFKTKPSTTLKIKKNPIKKTLHFTTAREKTKEILAIFRAKCEEFSRIPLNIRGFNRVDFGAMRELRKSGVIPKKSEVIMGSIPGVEIGDTFSYRVELMMVGLHRRNQHGIDFVKKKGDVLATCIVSAEGYPYPYPDRMDEGEVELLTYIGEGGMYGVKEADFSKDQKMERGNLALKNSLGFGNDVRVVKGVRFGAGGARFGELVPKFTYVYDGLYRVVECNARRDFKCGLVFEFKLRRNPGQAPVPWRRFGVC